MQNISIATPRLALAQLLASDANRLFEYRSDPDVSRFQSFEPESLADAQRFILAGLADDAEWHSYGIRLGDSAVLIGDLGIRFPPHQPGQAEVGITLAPKYQHRGFATEALRGLLGHLFCNMGMHRVFASVDPDNLASIALLKRVGMEQEACFRSSLWFKGRWADDVVFGMLETDWLALRQQAHQADYASRHE